MADNMGSDVGQSDAQRPRSARTMRDLGAWLAFLVAAVAYAAQFAPVDNHAVLAVAAFSPYVILSAGFSAVLLVLNRRRLGAALALLVLLAAVSPQVGRLAPRAVPADSFAIRVLTTNLRDGRADSNAVAAAARKYADLLFVQELSPETARALDERHLRSDFPYQALYPGTYAAGVGIWSRFPIVQTSRINGYLLGAITATVRPRGLNSDLVAASVHLAGPWPQPIDRWRKEIEALPETLEGIAQAAGQGAAIVAGDFNATTSMRPFRRIVDASFRYAPGVTPTYAADMVLPPLIRIDHILTRNSVASGTRTVRIAGSDHLGLAATVHIPS